MAGIFISYRRSDSDYAAGRLAGDLSEIFGTGSIFRDIDTLEPGEDYEKALADALASCEVLIAVIGPNWSTVTDDAGACRLLNPKDWVRLEIRGALKRGIRVIPILLREAGIPREKDLPADLRPLVRRQAMELDDRHWKQDVEQVASVLENIPGIDRVSSGRSRSSSEAIAVTMEVLRQTPPVVRWAAAIAVVSVVGWLVWYLLAPHPPALPARPGLNYFEDPLGRFSLKYPAFLGGVRLHSQLGGCGIAMGSLDGETGEPSWLDFILSGGNPASMRVNVFKRSPWFSGDSTLQRAEAFAAFYSYTESHWLFRERVITNRREDLTFYTVKEVGTWIPFTSSLYYLTLFRIGRERTALAIAYVRESDWQDYQKELEQSFFSIRLGEISPQPKITKPQQ